jgi:phosphoribosylanthranilate isomerase
MNAFTGVGHDTAITTTAGQTAAEKRSGTARMFKIKICGITEIDDALAAVDAGADAIGLNFYEQSPRFVREQTVRQIGQVLGRERASNAHLVGVFVNHSIDQMVKFLSLAGERSIVQLHGDESPKLVARVKLARHATVPPSPWQVIRVRRLTERGLAAIQEDLAACGLAGARPDAVLVDAVAPGSYGGTGTTVPWPSLAEHPRWLGDTPLILAGGLTPDNVAEAIRIVRPHAVDVASGVEAAPGKKDIAKMCDFVAAAKAAFAAL